MEELIRYFDKKDNVSLGKLLKEVENQTPLSYDILKYSSSRKGKAHIIGITGPPGSGKSTLVGKLCNKLAAQGLMIGVVCVDPTSPYTKGALLGDRIRMQGIAKLPNVFIKSLATRGNLGGLAASTADIVQVLDAYDKDVILIETVGVGQIEFDVLEVSDTVLLVNVPGLGDSLQTLKAGIMEIADIYVINQADRPGADESVKDLNLMVRESGKTDWSPPILKTVATQEEGIEELINQIYTHRSYLQNSGLWKEKRQTRNITRLNSMIQSLLSQKVDDHINTEESLQQKIEDVRNGKRDPYTISHDIVNSLVANKNTYQYGG
ncbi:methylmalonyl Co-A mutase-associated GTPase MeaB [Fictibacillus enclensis]|uniref:methylmalonyl Co-A mutase-associated GTPase MeaB n=1 Tax=Fictibacillus enclensis TaxID=1017270 RepID=UPI0025A13D49|nr:methylmalonyl Co-A mutase-associated GTPase MeaB [Fictibacillus enclensis]MDM5196561.1 methylmalonyl Co-A mutase-associated GTPase MeaB [Fictibacillus enclensis]